MKFNSVKRSSISYGSYNTRTLNGGVNVRSSPLLVSASEKGNVQAQELMNGDLFTQGAVTCRNSKQWVAELAAGKTYEQLTNNSTSTLAGVAGKWSALCIPFTASANSNLRDVAFLCGLVSSGSISCTAELRADSAGSPGTVIDTAPVRTFGQYSVTGVFNYFTFKTGAITSGTAYWLCIKFYDVPSSAFKFAVNTASGSCKTTSDTFATFQSVTGAPVGQIYINTVPVNGLYDYRATDTSGNYNQNIIAAINGALYTVSGSTLTSIKTGLSAVANNLYDFCTVDNIMISTDNAANSVQAWDGSVSSGNYPVMALGYRAAFSAAEASSGSIAVGTYKIMAVTQLKSGGYRASAEATVTVTGGSKKIALTSIAMNSSATGAEFGFDIDSLATTWFMTTAGGSVYYKLATASLSTGANPSANNTTSLDITASPAGTENTLLAQYGIAQGYFTGQVATPKSKYVRAWNGFLVMAGDPSNQSRLWVSELGAPQIWSGYGGIQGNYLAIGTDDGQVIRGLAVYNQFLYVFKNHSIYRVEYTGNASAPFIVTKTQGNVGTLSHWSIKEIPSGLVFMSEGGPAICYGNVSKLVGDTILPWFDQTSSLLLLPSTSFPNIVSGINNLKKQVWWVFEANDIYSTNPSGYKSAVLVWDWENNAWWRNDFDLTNYVATIGNSQGMDQIYSADYSGRVFLHENTNIYMDGYNYFYKGYTWKWKSPHFRLDDMGGWKWLDNLTLFFKTGSRNSTAGVDIFLDMATQATYSLTIDTASDLIESGLVLPFRGRCKTVCLSVSVTTDSNTGVAPQLQGIRIEAANLGSQT